jgi:hypothetical protein
LEQEGDSGADDDGRGMVGDADTIVSVADLRYSLETAMMELELARNRASTPQVCLRIGGG